ncbi:MAG: hypothetical protein QG608_2088 [Actinomycetota bacterium]|nr:hypothetical protein [Actinomycetota bacterium]
MAAESNPPTDDGALQAALGRLVASGALDLHQARAILQEYSACHSAGGFPPHSAPVPLQSGIPLSGMSAQNLQDQMYLRQAGYTFRYEPETGSVYPTDTTTYSQEIGFDDDPHPEHHGAEIVPYSGRRAQRTGPGTGALATTGALGGTAALSVPPASWEFESPRAPRTGGLRRSDLRARTVEGEGFFADTPDTLRDSAPAEDVRYENVRYDDVRYDERAYTDYPDDERLHHEEYSYEEEGDYEESPRGSQALEIGSYLIGLAFLGIAIWAVRPQWDRLPHDQQLYVLAGPSLVLLLTSLLIMKTTPDGWPKHSGQRNGPHRRITSVLLTTATALLAGAGWIFAADSPDTRAVTSAGAGAAVALLGYLICHTGLLNLTAALSSAATIGFALQDLAGVEPHLLGSAVAGFGLLWALMALSGILDELAVGLAASGILAIAGGEVVIHSAENPEAGFGIVTAAALMGLGSYMPTRHPLVLFVGMGSLALAASQTTLYFGADAIGSEAQPLVGGVSIATASLLGLMTWRITHREDLVAAEEGLPV